MITPVAVKCLPDYQLLITFSNGEKKIYNAQNDVHQGVLTKLQNKSFFAQAKIAREIVVQIQLGVGRGGLIIKRYCPKSKVSNSTYLVTQIFDERK